MKPLARARTLALLLAIAPLAGCGNFLTDAATRFGAQLCDEAAALRRSGETRRTFEHRPIARPEGISGDYRIELVVSEPNTDGHSLVLVGESYDGPLRYSTTAHNRCVRVEKHLEAPHRKGEATKVTLEMRDGAVWVTAME